MAQAQIQSGQHFSGMQISHQRQAGFILQGEVFIREVAFRFV
jgi:hypothetical protein